MSEIQIGRKVRCRVTGFTGVVTARCEYLDQSPQVLIQPQASSDKDFSEYLDPEWVVEARVVIQE